MLALLHAGQTACYQGLNTGEFRPLRPEEGE